jgi:hypothetical protein
MRRRIQGLSLGPGAMMRSDLGCLNSHKQLVLRVPSTAFAKVGFSVVSSGSDDFLGGRELVSGIALAAY